MWVDSRSFVPFLVDAKRNRDFAPANPARRSRTGRWAYDAF